MHKRVPEDHIRFEGVVLVYYGHRAREVVEYTAGYGLRLRHTLRLWELHREVECSISES
jgi:hypothetical protein